MGTLNQLLRVIHRLVDAAEEHLANIRDAEEHLHPETGKLLPDVQRLEEAVEAAKEITG